MDTTEKLNRLSEMQAQSDVMRAHFDALRAKVMTPEIKAALEEIAAEETTAMDALNGGIEALTAEIKSDVTEFGATVKGAYLMAVFSPGRITWDSKKLDRYSVEHPEIAAMRNVGNPSVALRKI